MAMKHYDRNMQVIQRARPYNTETDIKKAPQRAAQAYQWNLSSV